MTYIAFDGVLGVFGVFGPAVPRRPADLGVCGSSWTAERERAGVRGVARDDRDPFVGVGDSSSSVH